VLFACDDTSVLLMFYVVRAVHKFDFRVVINETPNKWRSMKSHTMATTHALTGSIGVPRIVVASVNGPYPSCAGLLHSLVAETVEYLRLGRELFYLMSLKMNVCSTE
jgi:hypothetical protein